jgi:hypothetical protein
VRPLLRWISLIGTAALLAVLGGAGTHQRNFPLFLASVIGLSVLAVTVFVFTTSTEAPGAEVDADHR